VKTQQAGKALAGAVVIYDVWRLAIALYLLVVPCCVKKSIHQTISRLVTPIKRDSINEHSKNYHTLI
jgi:uncharacterized protein YggT (Ycf19 family)